MSLVRLSRCCCRCASRDPLSAMAAPLSDACCDRPKVSSNYVPQGKMDKIGSVDVYRVGLDSDRVLLHLSDIFAFTNNNKQVADLLAQRSKCTVFMPDLLKGGWQGEWPVKDRQEDLGSIFLSAPFDFNLFCLREVLMNWINNDCKQLHTLI